MSYPNISPVFLSLASQYIYLLYSKDFFPDHAYCVCPRLMLLVVLCSDLQIPTSTPRKCCNPFLLK